MTLQQLQHAVAIADCGSINEAAKQLYASQPSLSHMIRELEKEIGIVLFIRSNRGITLTADGEEFLGYARQIIEQYRLMEERFGSAKRRKVKFSVSMQHYTFAVQAFTRVAKAHGIDQYAFAVHETKTSEVIEHVATLKSEVGVLYLDRSNREVLEKLFRDSGVEFIPLFDCTVSVYLAKNHPLAGEKRLSLEQLRTYPCLSFDQGANNSFHFAEEVLSTEDYEKIIKVDAEYMCAFRQHNDILEYFTGVMVGNDYAELLELYGQRIVEEAGKLREELREADSKCPDNLPISPSECVTFTEHDDLEGKVIVVKPDVLKREYQRASFQLYLCTGGSGSRPNSRGTTVYCTSLYSGESERFRRQNIMGMLPEADLPEWAARGLEQIRAKEKQRQPRQQER